MRNCTRYVAALVLAVSAVFAQNISGDWQGTVKTGSQETGRYRYLLHIVKEKNGWGGTVRTIDQRIDWGGVRPVGSVSLQGSDLKFSVEEPRGSFEGKVSPDWTSIAGTWKEGSPRRLEFLRPTKETEWRDDPRHSVQFISRLLESTSTPRLSRLPATGQHGGEGHGVRPDGGL
jgi:hypothetical protein